MKLKKPFKILPSKDGQFYVTVSSQNSEVLCTSEMLKTHQSAVKNILSILSVMEKMANNKAAWTDWISFGNKNPFAIKGAGLFHVLMYSPNKKVLNNSETFKTTQSAIKNIRAQLKIAKYISEQPCSWKDWEAFTVDITVQKPRKHE